MKSLVIYYSIGGNTRAVAEKIADRLSADLLELQTEKSYPDDYDMLVSLGKREVESGYLPQLKAFSADYEKYDCIVIGTPVWWYTYAPAVRTYLGQNAEKLKGKRVYPFATNGGWLGHTPSDFRRALKRSFVGRVLSVKFDGEMQVTPNLAIDEWIGEMGE